MTLYKVTSWCLDECPNFQAKEEDRGEFTDPTKAIDEANLWRDQLHESRIDVIPKKEVTE